MCQTNKKKHTKMNVITFCYGSNEVLDVTLHRPCRLDRYKSKFDDKTSQII